MKKLKRAAAFSLAVCMTISVLPLSSMRVLAEKADPAAENSAVVELETRLPSETAEILAAETEATLETTAPTTVEDATPAVEVVPSKAGDLSGTCGEGIFWTYTAAEKKLTISGTGSMTGVPMNGYSARKDVVTLEVQAGITSLYDYAFEKMSSLKNVSLPDGVREIGIYVFQDCTSLERIHLPDSIVSIGFKAFAGCTALNSVNYPKSWTTIPQKWMGYLNGWNYGQIFLNCPSLLQMTVPEGVTQLPKPDGASSTTSSAFAYSSIQHIDLPSTLETIYYHDFFESGIKALVIPDSVKRIESDAFAGCKQLVSISLPRHLEYIGETAFSGCASLENIVIPDSVTSIGESTFLGCSSLKEIRIPSKITYLKPGVFDNCSSLETVYLPASFEFFDDSDYVTGDDGYAENTFGNCSNLKNYYVDPNNQYFSSINGILCSKSGQELLHWPNGRDPQATPIPEKVREIGIGAFAGDDLTEITIPAHVKSIYRWAFFNCKKLSKIQFQGKTLNLGSYSFCNTAITSLRFPDDMERIDLYASSDGNTFTGCVDLKEVYFPEKAAIVLSRYAFSGCTALEKVNFPSGITAIPRGCFQGCRSLPSLIIPGTIQSIGPEAFRDSGIKALYFEGNAPTGVDDTSFPSGVQLNYGSGTGWTAPTWNGYQARQYKLTNGDGTSYTIIYKSAEGGIVRGSHGQAVPGEVIQLEVIPEKGYELVEGSLMINGKPLDSLSFVMPAEHVQISAKFESELVFTYHPIIYSDNMQWRYPRKVGGLIADKTRPPFPVENDRILSEEFQYWAKEFGQDITGLDVKELLDTPVKVPYITANNEIIMDQAPDTKVRDVMADILMYGRLQEYLLATEEEVKNSSNTVEQLNESTKLILEYSDRYSEYLEMQNDSKYSPLKTIMAVIALEHVTNDMLKEPKPGSSLPQLGLMYKFIGYIVNVTPSVESVMSQVQGNSQIDAVGDAYKKLDTLRKRKERIYEVLSKDYDGDHFMSDLPDFVEAVEVLIDNDHSRSSEWKRTKKCTAFVLDALGIVHTMSSASDFAPILSLYKVPVKYVKFAMDMSNFVTDQYASWIFWMNYYVAAYHPELYAQVGFDSQGLFSMDSAFGSVDSSKADMLTRLLMSFFDGKHQENAVKLFGAQNAYGMDQKNREILINQALMMNQIAHGDFRQAQEALVKYAIASHISGTTALQAQVKGAVSLELLDAEGNVRFILKPGMQYSQNYNEYCTFYMSGDQQCNKTIIYPDAYTLSIVPYDLGTIECSILENSSGHEIAQKNYVSLEAAPGQMYTVERRKDSKTLDLVLNGSAVPPEKEQVHQTDFRLGSIAQEMQAGETQQIPALLNGNIMDPKAVHWSSNHGEYVSVDTNGVVQAHAPGTAVITAIYQGAITVEQQVKITVLPDQSKQYTVTANQAGNGIIMGLENQKYYEGDLVRLAAKPGNNSIFAYWKEPDGTVHTNAVLNVRVNDHDFNVTAYFRPIAVSGIPAAVTADSITLAPLPDDAAGACGEILYGYGIAADQVTNWQASPVFEGLTAETEYKFFVRYAGKGSVLPSAISEGTVIKTAAAELVKFVGSNVIMGNNLDMMFAFSKNARTDWEGCYAEITRTYADSRPDSTSRYPAGEWTTNLSFYVVTYKGIAAKEMADTMTIAIYDSDGKRISEIWTDSLRDYATRILSKSEIPEQKTMVVDMLNYGAEAQKFFHYGEQDLANSKLSEEQKSLASQLKPMYQTANRGPELKFANLIMESNLKLMLAYQGLRTDMRAEISFVNHYGEQVHSIIQGSEFEKNNGFDIVVIDNLVIADARQIVTITIYNADESVYTVTEESIEDYLARRTDAGTLFSGVMKFADSTYAYLHRNQQTGK